MPPEQCPACGRFLKRAVVERLADVPAPCPKCGIELTPDMFGTVGVDAPATTDVRTPGSDAVGSDAAGSGGADEVSPATGASAATGAPGAAVPLSAAPSSTTAGATSGSVRPPDLPPAEVRDEPDPLAGWDADGTAPVRDERPFPLDTVAVATAAIAGAALGAVFGRRALRDGVVGAVGGAVGAGVARRIWRLP